MQIFCIADSIEDEFFGPFTDRVLAEKVLKIVQMAVDDGAELRTVEADQHATELKAGLLPWKIEVELSGKVVRDTQVSLTWPPAEEGIVEERDCYIRYFFWARSSGEAIRRLAGVRRNPSTQGQMACPVEEP